MITQFNSKRSLFSIAFMAMAVLFSPSLASAQEIDLLLKGGHVIDAKNKINSKMDVAVKDGKIYRVAADSTDGSHRERTRLLPDDTD